jgi:hypothetical protein
MRVAVFSVGVPVVFVLVGMCVPFVGHALGPPHGQSEMAVRPRVGMAVHTPAVPVGIGILACRDS